MRLDRPEKPYYTQGMKTALLAVALLASPALAVDPPADAGGPLKGTVSALTGDVTIQSKAGGSLAKKGSSFTSGDTVVTASNATAVLSLPDGSKLKMRGDSRLKVTLPSSKSAVTEALLSAGGVFAKVAKQLEGHGFKVRTPTAVAAVRGTEFFTAYGRARGKKTDLWVCVNEGAVAVTTDKSKDPLLVPAGKGILIKSGLDTTKPQAYDWTKTLNWNMAGEAGDIEDKTDLGAAYSDLLDQDYR